MQIRILVQCRRYRTIPGRRVRHIPDDGFFAHCLYWNFKAEMAADSHLALQKEFAAHVAHYALCDKQSHAYAVAYGLQLLEGLENGLLLIVLDADARVGHGKAYQPAIGLFSGIDAKGNNAVIGEFCRVGQQVQQDLLQARAIQQHGCGQGGLDIAAELVCLLGA